MCERMMKQAPSVMIISSPYEKALSERTKSPSLGISTHHFTDDSNYCPERHDERSGMCSSSLQLIVRWVGASLVNHAHEKEWLLKISVESGSVVKVKASLPRRMDFSFGKSTPWRKERVNAFKHNAETIAKGMITEREWFERGHV